MKRVATVDPGALQVFAAGSLKAAFLDIFADFSAVADDPHLSFGASGLLRRSIEKGTRADVFASADIKHAEILCRKGGWAEPVAFCGNSLALLAAPDVELNESVLDHMAHADLVLGMSTPEADPSGDYAMQFFDNIEATDQSLAARLRTKAVPLTGNAGTPEPPPGRNTYAWLLESGRADLFLTYRTNGLVACADTPGITLHELPETFGVHAIFGLTYRADNAMAKACAAHLCETTAQRVLAQHGFTAMNLVRGE